MAPGSAHDTHAAWEQVLVADFLTPEDAKSAVLASQTVQALCKADGPAAAAAAAALLRHLEPSAGALTALHQHLEVRPHPFSSPMLLRTKGRRVAINQLVA